MHEVGSIVKYEREQALRTDEKYSGKGKVIGTYRVYVIVDVAELDKPAPYTSAIHEGHVAAPPDIARHGFDTDESEAT